MTWARLALVLALLFCSTSVTAAEEAWMLWGQVYEVTPHDGAHHWTVYAGFKSRRQCMDEGTHALDEVITSVSEQYKRSGNVSLVEKERNDPKKEFIAKFHIVDPETSSSQHVQVRLVCLPDTIDPREKRE